MALLVATLAAVAWANSPWKGGYGSFLHAGLQFDVGPLHVDRDLAGLVNEGLMAVFFLLVGLEVKRELVVGELREWRTAALPAIAAVGGMALPAAIYVAVVAGGRGAAGWGVPTATDVAFAVGVLALLGQRVPASLRLFLLTLATVDDVVAIVIIAVGYAGGLSPGYLAAASVFLLAIVGLRAADVHWAPGYVVLGLAVWFCVLQSGVHATLAGAVLGLLVPARPPRRRALAARSGHAVSTAERVERRLHPVVSFGIVPLFALVNAGVALDRSALSAPGARTVLGAVVVARIVGKAVGIVAFAWLAVRLGVGSLPAGVGWRQMAGAAATAGVGFTVSLLLADVALPAGPLAGAAKAGTLAASVLAGALGLAILAGTGPGGGGGGGGGGAAAGTDLPSPVRR